MRLSVLDQSPIRSGGTAADAIHETLELAQTCERLGYHRYWLAEHPFRDVRAMPAGPTSPQVWLLGSSDASAIYAAEQGLAFSFAHFINADGGPQVTQLYRDRFRPSPELPTATASAAVWAVCAG